MEQIDSYGGFIKKAGECKDYYGVLCTLFLKLKLKEVRRFKDMIYSIPCINGQEYKRDVCWEYLMGDVDFPTMYFILKRRQ